MRDASCMVCTQGSPLQELGSLALLGLGGTAGALLFTTINPVAGAIFGGTFFLTSRAVRTIATKIFGELNMAKGAVCDLIALAPAIGITIGVLVAGAISINPATLAIVAASALVCYLLFQSIFLIKHCIQPRKNEVEISHASSDARSGSIMSEKELV